MDPRKISLDPLAVAWRLGAVALSLMAANLALQVYRLRAHVDQLPGLALISLDGEHNLPALFSTLLLLCAAGLLLLVAVLTRLEKAADAGKWWLLAAGFALMGLDEAMALHEKAIDPMRTLLGARRLGPFFFAWVIPAMALVAALGAYFLPFLRRLPRATAIAFALSATIYLGGALGVELVEGWWREGHGHRNLSYHLLVTLEEGLEMIGTIAFIYALLRHIGARFGEVRFGFRGAPASVVPAAQTDAGSAAAWSRPAND